MPESRALVIAMPARLDEVIRDLRDPDNYDYVRAMGGVEQNLSAKAVWELHFEPVANFWKQYKQQIAELGVTIYESGTLESLRSSLSGLHTTVTIFCHWKGHSVLVSDIKDAEGIARLVSSEQSRVSDLIRLAAGPEKIRSAVELTGGNECANAVAQVLNAAITMNQPLFRLNVNDEQLLITELELCEANRRQIDLWFSDKIVAGNRLELRDGLFAPAEIKKTISDNFCGLIHLYNCNSTILQRTLRSSKYRTLAQEEVSSFYLFIVLYLTVNELVKENNGQYLYLWLEVLTEMRNVDIDSKQTDWQGKFGRIVESALALIRRRAL